MRSSVSYILSHAPGETAMSHPDYPQQAPHHASLLVLVKGVGGVLKSFNKLWERIQRVNNIKVPDSSGQVRDIWVRFVRDYPVENNDWGDFQTHRRLLGLITISKFANQVELNEVCRVHESLKVKYSNTLYDSRAFMFGPSKFRKASPEGEIRDIFEEERELNQPSLPSSLPSEQSSSLPSDICGSLSSGESLHTSEMSNQPQFSSEKDEVFTTPSNFKTRATFYSENDPVLDLEQLVAELINSLFWVVESKRKDRSREKLEKVQLILAPFEKRDFVGLDMESRNNKKRCMGRVTKNLADLTLQAGLVSECLNLYNSAAEILKSVNDWLWLGAAYEGLCAASAILLYPNLRNPLPLQRNASLQESSPNRQRPLSINQTNTDLFRRQTDRLSTSPSKLSKAASPVSIHSDNTPPSSSESVVTSSETDNADSESIASSDLDFQSQRPSLSVDLPSFSRQSSQINNQFLLCGEDIAKKYREAIIHYSKYQNAGIIETEASFKAARISVEQNNSLQAASFLQNVVFINLTLSEQERIQRFDTLSELYQEISFLRKAAFCQRLAATRQVSPNNPSPDWQGCYYQMLHSFPGHKLSLDPNQVVQHQVGWPALQIQLLQELVVAARRMGHPALATRHMTFLLQTMWPHLTPQEQRDLALQLQALSAQCEGGPVPLVLETGEVIPPANLTHIPQCITFTPRPPMQSRTPRTLRSNSLQQQGPFLFTPIHFGSLDRKPKLPTGKMDYLWVENDICEVQLRLLNQLPFELKVSNMRLLTSGVVFESIPETVILQPDSPTMVSLHGTPKEVGQLDILGYSTHTLGVKSNCRLKNMRQTSKFLPIYSIEVIPSLPTISVECSLPQTATFTSLPSAENVVTSASLSLYNGESTECTITLTNTSQVAIEFIDVSVQSSMDSILQSRMVQWENEEIQKLLPIQPGTSATFTLNIYAEADFLDVGRGAMESMFPNSLNSNSLPSRMSSPTPTNPHGSLPQTQSSGITHTSLTNSLQPNRQLSGSFRSTNSQGTAWSAPLSVLPPTRGRQAEAQVIIRYSGGAGQVLYCRQASIFLNMELLPSVCITHWDVLPAEIPSQLYLVLDVANLTSQEMALHYTPNKHILIEGNEACRVPVPLERCPLSANIPLTLNNEDDFAEIRSSTTGNSSNSLELLCAEHITKNVDLKWHLLQNDIKGKASVKGITLSQAMMDIVRMSPLNWEVSLNSQCMKPQEEYNCSAGECLSLGVAISNQLDRPLHKLNLSVQFYQDYNNGVYNYSLDNRVATAGANKISLPLLAESSRAYHECTVIFLTPGQYKIDIQCSTIEAISEDLVPEHPIMDSSSVMNPCTTEVSHVWRFIPPVAITVAA